MAGTIDWKGKHFIEIAGWLEQYDIDPEVTKLDLTQTSLNELSESGLSQIFALTIKKFPTLKHLILDGNGLKSLPKNIIEFSQREGCRVDLEGNPLKAVESSFSSEATCASARPSDEGPDRNGTGEHEEILNPLPFPNEVINRIVDFLGGPYVEVFDASFVKLSQPNSNASEENKAGKSSFTEDDEKITELKKKVVVTALNENKTPLVKAYHIFIDSSKSPACYTIGFHDKATNQYKTKLVDEKSPLHVWLSQNPIDIAPKEKSVISCNKLLLQYLTREVKESGGHVAHASRDKAAWASTSKYSHGFFNDKDYKKSLINDAFEDLLHAVAYGLQDKAEQILKSHPEFLLSSWKDGVTDNTEVRTFKSTTAFQLAVWNGDWHMWQMMEKYIPESEKEKYEADIAAQLKELEDNGLTYTLDNLKTCGLRVLEGQPTNEQIQYVEKHNAYHLILDRANNTYQLGFCDQSTKKYVTHKLDDSNSFKKFIDDPQNQSLFQRKSLPWDTSQYYPHRVIREKAVLELARAEIRKHGGKTMLQKTASSFDYQPLLDALDTYSKNYFNWSLPQRIELWCVQVGALQRLLPAIDWHWLFSDQLPRDPDDFLKHVKEAARPAGNSLDFDGFESGPISFLLGDNFSYGRPDTELPAMRELWASACRIYAIRPTRGGGAGSAWLSHLFQAKSQYHKNLLQPYFKREHQSVPPTQPRCSLM